MSLTAPDFAGFKADEARGFLKCFASETRRKGEKYFHTGAVQSLECNEPGHCYSATVLGSELYQVSLDYDAGVWDSECTCPIGYECKHAYAAMKRLLAEQFNLTATGARNVPAPKAAPAPAVAAPVDEFAGKIEEKLGRKLKHEESRYVQNIQRLFRTAQSSQLRFVNELSSFGVSGGYWDRLELYPSRPRTLEEFWNYLALYLDEHSKEPIPDFMQPVTDVAKARAAMRKLHRTREVEQWNQKLGQYGHGYMTSQPEPGVAVTPVELRVRFLDKQVMFEWRTTGSDEWKELKPRKVDDFETLYAPSLSAEAALLWLAFWQRAKLQFASSFQYHDQWVNDHVGRWLRQPFLRSFFVNEAGGPLMFHEAPLRWQVTEPADEDGDYSFSLIQADGRPAPDVLLASPGRPVMYLTSAGVFSGPPFDYNILSAKNTTLIPAKAFESKGGLHVLSRLEMALPPRLAAKIRTIKLRPGVRAEVKKPWAGTSTEYCYLELYGASEDGKYAEYWMNNTWITAQQIAASPKKNDFTQFDRSALGSLVSPLHQAGFKWDINSRRWQLRVSKKFPDAFVGFLKSLPAETRIELGGELKSFQDAEVAGKIRLEASEAELDWFDLRVIVDVSDTTLSKEEIKSLLDAKGNWVRLDKKGWRKLEFALTEEEDKELAKLGLTPHELTSEPQRMHAFQLADRAARKFLPEETCERIERRASELQARVTPDLPDQIKGELRPYQRDGFHFLAYLSTNRFGGILADDMGLGKTLQTLSWLAWVRQNSSSANGSATALPSLVVCPKSVADNWHAEAAKFYPDLKVRVWPASDLKSFAGTLATADLHVLNYSQLRLVSEDLVRERFHAVILDEGQYIKNPSSQTAQVARQLRSEHRLVLSGTPIENRLLDLWSLMNFAMPGVLGNRAEFGRLYDTKTDPFARQRLSARVRPFLIRRTKAQVARDLPDRVEEDLFCELEGEQKTLYRAELKRAQAMLLGVKTAAALNKERFNFLTSLLRLRQICCHPKLVKPTSNAPSAKIEALFETLEPLIEDGQKVLVFSQFVELLGIVREEVETRGWTNWYLAGDTENRGALVKEFQAAEGAGVFLISLKAGGFGLNLTAASYVVLFDPWWNPAVENQAIDRTHRIGQDRKVIAYRLLIKDSIEEKIRALQRQKSSLADDVLGEEKFSQGLSLDDLKYLLEG